MYKCLECDKEYEVKPDFCECGNNTFAEIQIQTVIKPESSQEPAAKLSSIPKKDIGSMISIGIFVICLILSLCIWLFMWNVKPTEHPVKEEILQPAYTKLPNIEQLWNDTPSFLPAQETLTVSQPAAEPAIPIQATKPKVITKPKIETPKTQAKPQAKPQPKPQPQKPVESQQVKQEVKREIPKTVEKVQEKPQEKPQEVKKVEPPKKPVSNLNSAEFIKYKNALRSALFSKLAVGTISGTGVCEISFSVNSSGKLENRKFTKQSDNKTLNDAVYYMMMSVPQYYPPPKSYNGEILTLRFYFNNGNYEISYI